MTNVLKKAFRKAKYAAGFVKDTFTNIGDSIIAGQTVLGSAQAGIKVDADQLMRASRERNQARRAKRRTSKPT